MTNLDIGYGHIVRTPLPYAQALEQAKARLKEQGFGVLCEVDVSAALREKLGANFRPYSILGACNPTFAKRALELEPQLGLLLPCNVVVQEDEGETIVSAIDARAMLGVVGNPSLDGVADEVNARLRLVLDKLPVDPSYEPRAIK
jgi:uncharacterized protein (DUF302 family)